jgi:hypothetical protein
MKLFILLTILSFNAFGSEYPTDPCPRLERQEREINHELRLLRIEAHELAKRGKYPQVFDELGCEDVMDDATYVDRRINSLQKLLKSVRSSRARNCSRGDDIP